MRTIMILVLLFLASACSNMGAGRREVLNLPGRSDDLPFSHIVVAGHTVYVAGTIGVDPATGLAPADPEQEARLALDGVKAKLALADLTMDDLVSIQVFCSDLSLYGTFNAVYRTYFERDFPVRAFIGSGPLLRNGRFEISGIAVIP
ncbi:MAG: RidA family protein [Planctomycetota bacterium]|jgi:enamine deaminase RidA (YjgF/YER057c/UK114 family)